MTPLRQRMVDDVQLGNFSAETQSSYLHYIFGLARFYQIGRQYLSLEDLRECQLYKTDDRRYSPESVNCFASAAKFLYNVTVERLWPENAVPRARVPRARVPHGGTR
jgi:hypothetical protein